MSLGIDKAREIVKALASLINAGVNIDSDQDGKISTFEVMGLVQILASKVLMQFSSFKEALAQLKDVDSEERKTLILAFNEEFDLKNDEAETLIEQWLLFVSEGADLIVRTIKKGDDSEAVKEISA